jgi:hypothetical protein
VNEKSVGLVPFATSLMIVMLPGKTTASLESERSWLPPLPSRSRMRMWKGDPEIATAELLAPQLRRVAMCALQPRVGEVLAAVNVMVSFVELFDA